MTESPEFMDYNRYPPVTIFISQQDSRMSILVDPPNLLTVKIFQLLCDKVDLSQFKGRPNTKQILYAVKAVIEQSLQQWKRTREYGADQWPEVSVVIGRPQAAHEANFYYCGKDYIYRG